MELDFENGEDFGPSFDISTSFSSSSPGLLSVFTTLSWKRSSESNNDENKLKVELFWIGEQFLN